MNLFGVWGESDGGYGGESDGGCGERVMGCGGGGGGGE